MRRNVIETIMGAVVLVVAIGFIAFVFSQTGIGSPTGYRVTAEFDDVSGLAPGAEVRMSGVKIGTVVSQELDPVTFYANVELAIDERIKLPADTSARILADGLLGSSYVALSPGGAEDDLEPGGRITSTQGAISIVDLIGRFIFGGGNGGGSPADAPPPGPS